MNSPVQIPFKSFIQIDSNSITTIYLQIVHEFIKAIQLGFLPEGTKLPGSRILAEIIGVNRNTLIRAFEDLEAQGWIEILPNKGTFILSDQKQNTPNQKEFRQRANPPNANAGFYFQKSIILDNLMELQSCELQFNEGLPDPRLTQAGQLSKLYLSALNLNTQHEPGRYLESSFRKQLSNYLNLTRGIHLSQTNLLPTSSHQMSLYLATQLLIAKDDTIVVAELGHYASNMVFQNAGAKVLPIPIDGDGISIPHLEKLCREHSIRMLYLTPFHHYPTTVSLSPKRRMEVLELANKYGFIILENDYDYVFRYDNNSMLPLSSFDAGGMVVYIGSFGGVLGQGFSTGYIAASTDLIIELEKHQQIIEPNKDFIKEEVLSKWISEGEIHRYLKKSNKIYRERRDNFAALLKTHLDKKISFSVPSGGLAIWVEWNININLGRLKRESYKNGLFLPQNILYQNRKITAMRLGFGHLTQDEAKEAIQILKQSVENSKNHPTTF